MFSQELFRQTNRWPAVISNLVYRNCRNKLSALPKAANNCRKHLKEVWAYGTGMTPAQLQHWCTLMPNCVIEGN